MKRKEEHKLIELIEDKINEAENCEEEDITEEFIKGYTNGLKMAIDIIKEHQYLYDF